MKSIKQFVFVLCAAPVALASCSSNGTTSSEGQNKAVVEPEVNTAAPTVTTTAPMPGEGLRIAWVNMDSVLHAYDYYFQMEREMNELSAKAEKELTEKGKVLEKRVMDFQENMQKGLLTRSEAQKVQDDLQQEQNRFLQLQQSRRQSLAEEEQVRLRKVQNAITEFCNRYSAENGYNYILSGAVLYGDPRLSVTREVIDGLNAEYAKQKADKK